MVLNSRSASAALMRGVDELFTSRALVAPRREDYDPEQRIREGRTFVDSLGSDFGRDVDAFFPEVGRAGWSRKVRRDLGDGHVVDLRTPSEHRVHFREEAANFDRMARNQVAWARHFRHQVRHRPAVVFIHGFMAGDLVLEELEWPTHAFYRQGLDVVLAVLPGHGPRKLGRPWDPPEWPARTPTFTIEGYRQAIGELRGLVTHLLDDGATHVATVGMSLGGYTAALWSTVDPRLSLVAPFIPLASTADFLRDNGQLRGTPEQVARQHLVIEDVFASVSPLTRPCQVPLEGRMVFGGVHDRVTPLAHAERLAAHFGVEVRTFPGAHILQYRRWDAWRDVLANLRGRGILRDGRR